MEYEVVITEPQSDARLGAPAGSAVGKTHSDIGRAAAGGREM